MSETRDGKVHIDQVEASGGVKNHGVRYVLGISLLAAILVLSAIWIFGAATSDDAEEPAADTGEAIDRPIG